jgi:glycosyltransferase involved in cell wall biosynthesis
VKPRVVLVAAGLDILGGHCVEAGLLVSGLEELGYPVRFLPINPRFPAALRWLRRVPYARTLLNQAVYLPSLASLRRADLVHVFSASYWSFLLAPAPAILAARALGKRVVLHYHSGEAEDHLARWGRRVHPFLRLAHEIVVPSEFLREVFARHGYRVRVIPNIVDESSFAYRRRSPLAPSLISTRNLEPYYRVDTTLEAFALLRAQRPDATLTIAGTGSQEDSLRRRAAALDGSVRFVGRVEPEDMPELLDRCDVFVNSSVVDNQPVSILEAFAAGLPVVSTPTGGIGEMVKNEETGLVVEADHPEATAQALARLLSDQDRALAMAERARAEVEKYTWRRVRDAWAAAYGEST